MWQASIDLIAWKNLSSDESPNQEKLRLSWIVDDEGLEQSKEILDRDSITKLKVRKEKNSMMLIEVLESRYEDQELEGILEESLNRFFVGGHCLYEQEAVPFEAKKAFYKFASSIITGQDRHFVYVKPILKVKVRFRNWTSNNMLRTPEYVGFVSELKSP